MDKCSEEEDEEEGEGEGKVKEEEEVGVRWHLNTAIYSLHSSAFLFRSCTPLSPGMNYFVQQKQHHLDHHLHLHQTHFQEHFYHMYHHDFHHREQYHQVHHHQHHHHHALVDLLLHGVQPVGGAVAVHEAQHPLHLVVVVFWR